MPVADRQGVAILIGGAAFQSERHDVGGRFRDRHGQIDGGALEVRIEHPRHAILLQVDGNLPIGAAGKPGKQRLLRIFCAQLGEVCRSLAIDANASVGTAHRKARRAGENLRRERGSVDFMRRKSSLPLRSFSAGTPPAS